LRAQMDGICGLARSGVGWRFEAKGGGLGVSEVR